MKKVVNIRDAKANQTSARTKRIRKGLFKAAKNAVDTQMDDIRGFALVTWDDRGFPTVAVSASDTNGNPVSLYLVPTYVQSQLQRYVNADDRTAGIVTNGLVE